MRSFLKTGRSGARSERLREKYRSQFRDGGKSSGNRLLQKFRRNRQILAREFTSFVLWLALTFMMVPLGRALWRVSVAHLSDRTVLWRYGLPGLSVFALVFCLLRARAGWREIREIRAEQAEILAKLRQEIAPEDVD
jgi:hypothetical protein